MASESSEQLFLVDYFREFYAAVLQHRMQIERSLTPSPEEDSIQIREADILAEEKVPGEEQSQIAPDIVHTTITSDQFVAKSLIVGSASGSPSRAGASRPGHAPARAWSAPARPSGR